MLGPKKPIRPVSPGERVAQENPDARIRVAGTGFSRGAESRGHCRELVDERGIRDPTGVEARFNKDGVLTSISWPDNPPLEPPGKVPTAFVLIDPVGTGQYHKERKLPASNVGMVQFTSWLEPRNHFSSTQHAPLGLSDQGRVANFALPGAHSDMGGYYHIDGVSRLVYNFHVDYLSTVVGGMKLEKVPERRTRACMSRTGRNSIFTGCGRRRLSRGGRADHAPEAGSLVQGGRNA